jgi:hypothetical protein
MRRIVELMAAAVLVLVLLATGALPRTLNRSSRDRLGGGSFRGSGCTVTTATVATMCTGAIVTSMGGTGSGSAPLSSHLGDDAAPKEGRNSAF